MTELRKCPFCGGEAIIVNEATRKNVYGEAIKGTAIGCRNCGCQMFNKNRELAIEAWNGRMTEAEIREKSAKDSKAAWKEFLKKQEEKRKCRPKQ